MEVKNKPIMIGDYTWKEMRDLLLIQIRCCENEEEFMKIMTNLAASIGTKEDIVRVRKAAGIKKLTKKELEKMDG